MYFVLSPAKSLNETDPVPIKIAHHYSQPELITQSQDLMRVLKTQEPMDLQSLMGISDNLAQLNAQRNQDWAWSKKTPLVRIMPSQQATYSMAMFIQALISIGWTKQPLSM